MPEDLLRRGAPEAAAGTRADATFVGRTAELELLVSCLAAGPERKHAGAVIEGEPGIGKTRLVTEALARAPGSARILRGWADELQRDRPFGGISDALGPLDGDASPYEGRLLELLDGAGTPERIAGPQLRAHLVDAFVAVVRERSRARPVALVVEDLQWADAGTLAVLGELAELAQVESLSLLLTLRGSPRSRSLDRLLGQLLPKLAVHVPLRGLAPASVGTLVEGLLGAAQGEALRRHVARASGNPLYVVELLAALAEQGSLTTVRGTDGVVVEVDHASLPPSMRMTLLRRLSVLPPTALEVLRLAALLGTTFTVDDLAVVLDETPVRVLHLLREPMRGGWVQGDGSRLAFRHDLVREALTDDTPEAVRRTLHRQIVRRLLATGRAPSLVATHLLLGADGPDPQAATWLREAGRRALSREPAVAVDLLAGAGALDPHGDDRDAVELELGLALLWAGRIEEGEATLRGLLERPHDPAVDAEAGLALARSRMLSGATAEAVEVLVEVAARTAAEGPWLRLTAERSLVQTYRGELAEATRAVEEVIRRSDVRQDEAHCLARAVRATLQAIRGDMDAAIADADDAVAVAARSPDRETSRVPPQLLRASVLMDADRFDDGWRDLAVARRVSEDLGTAWDQPVHHLISARGRLLTGEIDDAVAESETALHLSREEGVHVMEAWGHAMIALAHLHRLELDAARLALDEGDEATARAGHQVRGVDWLLWARSRLAWIEGDAVEARQLLRAVWDAHRDVGMNSERRLLGPDLVELHLDLDERDEAAEVAAAVVEAAERMGTRSALAAGHYCRGLVDGDVEALLAAAELTRPTDCRPEHVAHCLGAGAALAEAGEAVDAQALLEEARGLAEGCGLHRQVRRADGVLRVLGVRRGARGARSRPTTGWASLTPTERTIALLAAEGLTNPEIGERLFISRRTVQTHLSHVFAKLGLASRVQLAAYVVRDA